MTHTIGTLLLFLLGSLLLWALLRFVYLRLQAAVASITAAWRRHQCRQQYYRAVASELTRVDHDAAASIQKLHAAFLWAQQQLRQYDDHSPP